MSIRASHTLVLGACLVLSACGGGDKNLEVLDSKLVAKVNGQAVTMADVKAEAPGDAGIEVQQAAADLVIGRKLLVAAAEAQKLDKTAAVKAQMVRGYEVALANAYGEKLAAKVPAPTEAQVAAFIAAHPEAFAERKYIVIDQLEMIQSEGALAGDNRAPPKTIEEFEARLTAANVPFQHTVVVLDSAAAPPAVLAQILAVPTTSVFELNNGDRRILGRVIDVRPAPFTNAAATRVATNFLKNRAVEAAVKKELATLRAAAAGKISYEKGYSPAPKTN